MAIQLCVHGFPLHHCNLGCGDYQMQQAPNPLPQSVPAIPETDDERAARRRQERFERVGIAEAPAYMPEDRYKSEYLGRTWFMRRDVMLQAEECLRICHCWKCEVVTAGDRVEATRFFVRFEDDPLQNYPALAHLTCHRCGYEEYYPLRMDPRKQRDAQAANTYQETLMRQRAAEEKMKVLHDQHQEMVARLAASAAKKLGIPSNMLESEAEAMSRIVEHGLERAKREGRGLGDPYLKTATMPAQQPQNGYGQQLEQIARSISDPDARRKFVSRALKEQGKT